MRLCGSTCRGAYHTGQASSADHASSLRSLAGSEQGSWIVVFTTFRNHKVSDWLLEGPICNTSGACRGMAALISFGGSAVTSSGQSRYAAQTKKCSDGPCRKDSRNATYMYRGCAKL